VLLLQTNLESLRTAGLNLGHPIESSSRVDSNLKSRFESAWQVLLLQTNLGSLRTAGLNLINQTNLEPFNPEQRAECFKLKATYVQISRHFPTNFPPIFKDSN
jgi:hypothetical protein